MASGKRQAGVAGRHGRQAGAARKWQMANATAKRQSRKLFKSSKSNNLTSEKERQVWFNTVTWQNFYKRHCSRSAMCNKNTLNHFEFKIMEPMGFVYHAALIDEEWLSAELAQPIEAPLHPLQVLISSSYDFKNPLPSNC